MHHSTAPGVLGRFVSHANFPSFPVAPTVVVHCSAGSVCYCGVSGFAVWTVETPSRDRRSI